MGKHLWMDSFELLDPMLYKATPREIGVLIGSCIWDLSQLSHLYEQHCSRSFARSLFILPLKLFLFGFWFLFF